MANTIASATGYDSSRRKDTHRLGSVAAGAQVATFATFCQSYINSQGAGSVSIRRGHKEYRVTWNAEDSELKTEVNKT